MSSDVRQYAWPAGRAAEVVEVLARERRLSDRRLAAQGRLRAFAAVDRSVMRRGITAAAEVLGIDAEPLDATYADVERVVRAAAPALVELPGDDGPCLLALTGARRGAVRLVGPDAQAHAVPVEVLCAALRRAHEQPHAELVDGMLRAAQVPAGRLARARTAMLGELLGAAPVAGVWVLSRSPGGAVLGQARSARLPQTLGALVGAHTGQHVLSVLAWWTIGFAAMRGRWDAGWLLAWTLLLASMIPFRLLALWSQGRIAYAAGALLKRRLLLGALRMDPQETRRRGSGQLLGTVIESEAVESLTVSGALLGAAASIEALVAFLVLCAGAASTLLPALFVAWLALSGGLSARFWVLRKRWTGARLSLTHLLTERMIGHRTRLAQQSPEHWHDGEDEALAEYASVSRAMDGGATLLLGAVVRGWILVSLTALAPTLFRYGGTPTALAVAVGGILLAARAIAKLNGSFAYLADAAIAWRQIAPLFHAAAAAEPPGDPFLATTGAPPAAGVAQPAGCGSPAPEGRLRLDAFDVSYRYGSGGRVVLDRCSVSISCGERLLLLGPSGCGKSTLLSLLGGQRTQDSGVVLLHGLDRPTVGAARWRQRVALVPQFNENFVLTGTLAFNLLMGRGDATDAAALNEAEVICHELGLGPLLSRMPNGLSQLLGETGWQLSHGERSRVYLARALLQQAEVILLDESFAALDPPTLNQALACTCARAPALVVVAHP